MFNHSKIKYIVGGFHLPPRLYFRKTNVTNQYEVTGFIADIINLLSQYLGFNYKFVKTDNFKFGRYYENNDTWDGLIGKLVSKEIDFEGVALYADSQRIKFVDTTSSSLYNSYMAVVVKQPNLKDDYEMDLLTYFKPFTVETWIAIITLCFLFLVCVLIANYFKGFKTIAKIRFSKKNPPSNFKHNYLILPLLICMVILLASYNTFLIASLTIKKNTETFKSLSDILKFRKYKFITSHSGMFYTIFQKSKSSIFQQVFKRISNDFVTESKAYKIASKKKFAIMTNSISALKEVEKRCELRLLKKKYFKQGMYLSFPKKSALQKPFSIFILRLRSSGILDKLIEDYVPSIHRPHCQKLRKKGIANSLKLIDVVAPFLILCFGIATSIMLLLMEHIYNFKMRTK